jgi:hypothetical protein
MVSIIPRKEIEEKTLAMSQFFETTTGYPECYGVTSGNHDGAGLSHGVLQYNFGSGSLKTLWSYMINTYPTLCQSIMGDNYAEWEDVVMNRTVTDQIAWGDSISTPKDGSANDRRFVIEPWKTLFDNLGQTQESIDKQVSMSSSWRVNADNWFNAIPELWSRRAYYLFWDISVQMGRFNPLAEVQTEFADTSNYVGMTEDEAEQWRCERLAWHSAYNNAVSSTNQPGVYKRKMLVATGSGDYYGTPYDGVEFDAILEPYSATERTYTFPVITTLVENNLRTKNAMSSAPGYNQTVVTIAFDKPITRYKVCRGGTDHLTGVVLEDVTVSKAAGETFTIYVDYLDLVNGDNTLYFYGMDASGAWSDGYIPAPTTTKNYRYLRISMFGDNTGATYSRLVEINCKNASGTNILLNKTPTSYTTLLAGTIGLVNDGNTTVANRATFNTNPARVVWDFTSNVEMATCECWFYAAVGDQRYHNFKVEVSRNNIDWVVVGTDYTNNSANSLLINNTNGYFPDVLEVPST